MKISIVIPAYNEEHYIGPCLESIKAQHSEDIFEIIVVDNGSKDNTAAIAKKIAGVKVLHESAKGPTHARERGLAEAKGDFVAFIDGDTRLPAGWTEKVKKEFAADPKLISLSGPFRYYDLPPFKKFCAELLWDITAPVTYWIVGFMILAANCVVRREALTKIGGLDTTIAFYGDDTNLAFRLSKLGKVKFVMSFYILGSGRRLAEEGLIKTFWLYGINYLWTAFRHKPYTNTSDYKDVR